MSDEQDDVAGEEPVDEELPEEDVEAEDVDAETDEADESAAEVTDEETTNDDADDADDAGDSADDEAGGIQEGDFVRLAYTARTVESDRLVDTTDEAVAEDEGVDTEDREFEPRVLALGAGHIFQAVEEDIYGKAVGDSGSVVVPAADAFGEFDSEKVRTVSADTIPEDDRYPGGHVDIDGQHGHVETIIGGRARVDFNHPLAGEDVEYSYEIVDEVEDRIEQASGLLQLFVDADLEMWIQTDEEERTVEAEDEEEEATTETVELETLYIESVPQLSMNQQWLFQKRQIAQDLIDRLGIDRVIVQETIEGMGGMFGGMGGMGLGGGLEDVEAAIEEADVDAEEIAAELEDEVADAADEGAASSVDGDGDDAEADSDES